MTSGMVHKRIWPPWCSFILRPNKTLAVSKPCPALNPPKHLMLAVPLAKAFCKLLCHLQLFHFSLFEVLQLHSWSCLKVVTSRLFSLSSQVLVPSLFHISLMFSVLPFWKTSHPTRDLCCPLLMPFHCFHLWSQASGINMPLSINNSNLPLGICSVLSNCCLFRAPNGII